MIIIGSGLSGLLCAIINPKSRILEAAKYSSFSTHKAILRLRTSRLEDITGVPLKMVRVHKEIWSNGKAAKLTIANANRYSSKVSGHITNRSILSTETVNRYIPPSDLFAKLRALAPDIEYESRLVRIDQDEIKLHNRKTINRSNIPVISTIPLNAMASMAGIDYAGNFSASAINVTHFNLKKCDAYYTIYYPDSDTSMYRASMNGDTLIVESTGGIAIQDVETINESFGISLSTDFSEATLVNHVQHNGKMIPIDAKRRQKTILDLSIKQGIYSLGRFGTWRPKVMVDDVIKDIYQIRSLINKGNYAASTYKQEEK